MKIELKVNGERRELDAEPRLTLADALRENLSLTGTHIGCEHGVCGSCTVTVDGEAVRSCLMFAVQCNGREVGTVEGLAARDGTLHPLQEAFIDEHGLQCGFCTPGFLVLGAAALEEDPGIAEDEEALRELLTSNICRCTGYEGIRRAVVRAAETMKEREER